MKHFYRFISALIIVSMLLALFANAANIDAVGNQKNDFFTDEFTNRISNANTEIYSTDEFTLSVTSASAEQNRVVVESDDYIATTLRNGSHFIITEVNKLTGEEKVIEHYMETENLSDYEQSASIETNGNQEGGIAPRTVEVDWRSNYYIGDGYIYWPNSGANGAYVLRLQREEIYTTGSTSSRLKRYAETFVTNIHLADSYYQDACEDLVDLSPVGAAKAVAELITLISERNVTIEAGISFLISMFPISDVISATKCVNNAWNANQCHTKYEDAWYDAEPLCVPW